MIILRRVSTGEHGTFGVLIQHESVSGYERETPFALTVELPWRGNLKEVSCIPAGNYQCVKIQSPKFGETFEVYNVPERTSILFHKGNTIKDTQGCILVGERFESVGGIPGIQMSGEGYGEFMKRLDKLDGFMLHIENCF